MRTKQKIEPISYTNTQAPTPTFIMNLCYNCRLLWLRRRSWMRAFWHAISQWMQLGDGEEGKRIAWSIENNKAKKIEILNCYNKFVFSIVIDRKCGWLCFVSIKPILLPMTHQPHVCIIDRSQRCKASVFFNPPQFILPHHKLHNRNKHF